jgi:hypothetical protein
MSVSPRLIRAFHLPAALSQLTPLCFDEGGRAGPADTGSSHSLCDMAHTTSNPDPQGSGNPLGLTYEYSQLVM